MVMYRIYCAWTGSNPMPPKRLECFQKLTHTTECEIVCITPHNLDQFILPEHPLHPAYPYLSETHKADYLRCYLMHFYGGGWSDIKLQSGSWKSAFDDLMRDDRTIANGYATSDGHVIPSCRHESTSVIGSAAFLFKPNTEFTQQWYITLMRVLDERLESLKQNPARHPQAAAWDRQGYPLEWSEILGDIYQPLCLKYKDRIIKTLPQPDLRLETYRF